MTDAFKLGKRALTSFVALATIISSIGISALVAPLQVRAASAGDLIKGTTLATLYYYAADGKRYTFPNEKTFSTWYTNFNGVKTISDSELAAIPLAGNIVYRPGVRWIKIQSDPKTYAVTPQGKIRWIESEAVAVGLAGSDWNTMIDDVADTFFVDYALGSSLMSAADAFNGALVTMSGTNYLVWNGQKRMVTSEGSSANWFQTRAWLDGTGITLAGLSAGSDVTAKESTLTDVAQLGQTVTGGLSVSLASDTPASATIPQGAASVPFLKVKLMATSGDVTIDQLEFKLGGVGAVSNFGDTYLYNGDVRWTDGRSINSSSRVVTFGALNLKLKSGETSYLTLRGDISTTAVGSDTANFSLVSTSSVSGTATVSGNFPVTGNTMTFSETDAGTLVVDASGSITDPTIGEGDATIAKFTLEADDEDASVERITLNVDDAGDHSDFKLWKSTTLLASGTVSSDLVTFVLSSPLKIDEGNTETLKVSADIGGESNDVVAIAVEEEADVLAIGGDFGFNMSIDITGYDETGTTACATSADDCSRSEIIGGELTFAFNGPSSDDVCIDCNEEVFFKFKLTAENWTEVKEIQVQVECVAGSASGCDDAADNGDLYNDAADEPNLQDIKIRKVDSGTTWMGPEELDDSDDTLQTLTFSDDQVMTAGTTLDLEITADVNTDAIDADIYQFTILTDQVVAEDANGDELTAGEDIIPSADLAGNDFTLTDAEVTVDLSSPPSSGTYVKGASNVSVVGFTFDAGDSSDILIEEVTFGAMGDDDGSFTDVDEDLDVGDFVQSCSIYDNESGALIDGPESVTSDDEVQFDSFSWTIEAGESDKLLLKCNFANVDNASDTNDAFAFFIASADDIVAQDEDGDEIDATLGDDNTDGEVAIAITDGGTLAISQDGSTAKSTIILGSSTGVAISKFKFSATDEPQIVKTISLRNCVTSAVDANDDCDGEGDETEGDDDIAANVKVSYLDKAGATKTKTGFLSGGMVTFENLDFYVPTSGTRVLTVTADTNSVSSTGATSGSEFQLNFDAETTGTAEFEAVGEASGEKLTEADVDTYVLGNKMEIRKTKLTIDKASGSPSGASVPGLSEVFRFNVTADSRGFVQLNEVMFKVTSTDGVDSDWNTCANIGVAGDWELYDINDSSEKLDDATDYTFRESDGSACEAGDDLAYVHINFEGSATNPAEEIGAGETKTYILRADTTGADTSEDDSFRIDIPDESEVDALATSLDAISWEDDVEGAGAGADDDDDFGDIDGEYVKNLPVTGGTLVY